MNNKMITLLTVVMAMVMSVGCNKKMTTQTEEQASTTTATGFVSNENTSSTVPSYNYTSGSTVTFTPADQSLLNAFVASYPTNNPQNFKVNVQLQNVGNLRYGGNVSVSFYDNSKLENITLASGLGVNQKFSGGSLDDGKYEAEYNYWYTTPSGKPAYTGFFQDNMRAIVLVLETEQATNQADGQTGQLYIKGSVWFKTFPATFATQSPYRKCWFIFNYTGGTTPYDCRSTSIIQKSSTTPTDGYRLLGTFQGLNVNAAFGI